LPGFLRDEAFTVGTEAQRAPRRLTKKNDDDVAEGAETEARAALLAMGIEEAEKEGKDGCVAEKAFVESLMERHADTFSATLTRQGRLTSRWSSQRTRSPLPHRAPYPLPAEQQRALQESVGDMAAAGLIQRHDGPASCPMFLVKKRHCPARSRGFGLFPRRRWRWSCRSCEQHR